MSIVRSSPKMFRCFLACIFVLVVMAASTIVSCAPSIESATSAARQTTPPAARSQNATPTRTPSPNSTATPTASPTFGSIVLPTPPANGISLALAPDTDQTGWVSSGSTGPFQPDNNLNVGIRQGQTFASIMQFDVTQLAPGTKILFAALELSGRNGNNLGTDGQWNLDVLDTQKALWDKATYDDVRRTPTLFAVSSPLPSSELAAGVRNRFILSAQQLELLQKQIDRGNISIRLSGPTSGGDNFFVWEASPGIREPKLYLVATPGSFTVITATPTAVDVFAAATQVVAQTLQARQFGTPTPLPRSMITATPLPYVVITDVPTAVNPAQVAATSAYVTAVAMTTGTFTPYPLNWITATPPPLAIPVGSLTLTPTATATLAPIWLPDLAKKPLPAALYNKIAFLNGDRSNPTAWIMDPDGSNLAQLSDRIYYDIAAARDTISPDGTWLLYNAPDLDRPQILQLWRVNLKSPSTPPQQMTFFARGISFAPAWSSNDSKFAFTSTKDGREQEIFLYDFNNPRTWPRLSFSQEQYLWNQYPTWSPDDKQIAFSSDRGHIAAYTEIWVMNADGSGAKKLGDGSRDAWAPVWIKWVK